MAAMDACSDGSRLPGMDANAHDSAATAAACEAARWQARSTRRAWSRLTLAAGTVAVGFWFLGGGGPWALTALIAGVVLVLATGAYLATAQEQAAQHQALADWHRRGTERVQGRWQGDPERWQEPDEWHPYAGDCDLLGPQGLLALIDSGGSRAGARHLADWLLARQSVPDAQAQRVQALQAAPEWRARLAILAQEERPLPAADALQDAPPALPGWGRIVVPALRLLLLLGLIALAWAVGIPGAVVVALALALLLAPLDAVARSRCAPAVHADAWAPRIRAWLSVLAHCRQAPEAAALRDLQGRIEAGRAGLEALRPLADGWAQAANPVWRFGPGALLLNEWRLARRWGRWWPQHAAAVSDALAAVAELEAVAHLATYADEQGGCWPIWSENAVLCATALAHPLLPRQQRVSNDCQLSDGHVLLLTGANASGKSTYLRAAALAVVLARAGAPVCASDCRLHPQLQAVTVMRVQDALLQGLSRFQAEVRQLRLALDAIQAQSGPSLLCLDEILAGTNSRERHLGTRAILADLRGRPGAVLVTTHDLELAAIASEDPAHVELAHFADRAEADDEDVRFDYQLRPGVLQTTNALRVMRSAGLPVPLAADQAD